MIYTKEYLALKLTIAIIIIVFIILGMIGQARPEDRKMKVIDVYKVTEHIVETDDSPHPTYRTDGLGSWERLMGNSWEPVFYTDEIQELYEEKIKVE